MTERASTATVVFTDLVGSTALRARLGEERADVLQAIHDGILTARVEANGGQVLKRMGDGMVAVFPAASDALTATVQIQQAIARHNRRPDAVAELSIRIGLSTGDVSWKAGDCFGTPMVEAARLEAAAAGGQILCSDFVRMMARGRGGHEFSELGFLELKGLPEPLAACEVVWSPEPELSFPLPRELTSGTGRAFVSRTAELELAQGILVDAGRERAAVLWVLGEPGIGKTRLATEVARRAHDQGAVVVFGRCNEDLSVPYQPFLEALRFFTSQLPDEELDERLGEWPGELARLLPELEARLRHREPPRPASAEVEQYRLFEAVRSWLAAAGGAGPVIVVLDDVQWAAQPTLQLLGHIARSAEVSRLLLVATARNTSPDDNEALAELVEDLARKGVPGHRIELGGLDVDEVGELVSTATGRRLDDRLRTLAADLTAETGGNPLFVDALLASLPADPAWHAGRLPRTVAETVRRRMGRLPADVHDLLRIASVVGLDFDLRVAARAAGRNELDVLEALESAGRAGLVDESGVNRYRFAHALVRSALRDELSRSRLARLHLDIGEALETLHDHELEDHASALAYHFFEAVPVGGAGKAYRYSLLAAERAARVFSFREAADAYGRALEMIDSSGDPDPLTRARLLIAQGRELRKAGDFRGALEILRAGALEARDRAAPELMAEAAVAFEDASFEPGLPGSAAADLLEQAEAALGSGTSSLHVLTAASLGRALGFSGRWADGIARCDEALLMARQLGDPAVTGAALIRALFGTRPGTNTQAALDEVTIRTRAARTVELVELAEQLNDDELYWWSAIFFLQEACYRGDLPTLDHWLAELARYTNRLHQPIHQWEMFHYQHFRALIGGDLSGAEEVLKRSEEVGESKSWGLEGVHGISMFLLRREQGRLAGLAPVVRTIVELNPQAALWGPGLALLYAELGMLEEARAALDGLAATGFTAVPNDGTRELCLGFLAEAAVAVGDVESAEWLLGQLLVAEGVLMVFWGSLCCLGPADRLLGMLCSVLGRSDEAEAWFERALALSRGLPSPLWIAHCLYDFAAHQDRAGESGGEAMLLEAAELCRDHGLIGLGERVDSARAGAAGHRD